MRWVLLLLLTTASVARADTCQETVPHPAVGTVPANLTAFTLSADTPVDLSRIGFGRRLADGHDVPLDFFVDTSIPTEVRFVPTLALVPGNRYVVYRTPCAATPDDYRILVWDVGPPVPLPTSAGALSFSGVQHDAGATPSDYIDATLTPGADLLPWVTSYQVRFESDTMPYGAWRAAQPLDATVHVHIPVACPGVPSSLHPVPRGDFQLRAIVVPYGGGESFVTEAHTTVGACDTASVVDGGVGATDGGSASAAPARGGCAIAAGSPVSPHAVGVPVVLALLALTASRRRARR